MADTTDALPRWWHEIADELAHLNIAAVSVVDTGTATSPAWTVIVTLHFDHFHYRCRPGSLSAPVCGALPWVFAPRPTEEAAWEAAQTFLRGVATVRKGTVDRVPSIEPGDRSRLAGLVCPLVEAWHDEHHAVMDRPALESPS